MRYPVELILDLLSMKKFNFISLFFILFFFQEIKSQTEFKDGYVIISLSDTIYGKIDNKDYYSNSQYCDFLNPKTNSVTRYKPDQIFGYRFINGKFYVSKNIEIDNKSVVLFMEYLIHGRLDIYFYQDNETIGHYFASKDTLPLKELKNNKVVIELDGKNVLYESKNYMGLLKYYTSDCPVLSNEITNLREPSHNNLIDFSKKYHNLTCSNEKCIIYEKKLPNKLLFSIFGGSTIYFSNKIAKPCYGFNFLFQQPIISERVYLGIGFTKLPEINMYNAYQIPFSINYLNPRMGFSPILSCEFDLVSLFLFQAYKVGFKFQNKKISYLLYGDLKLSLIAAELFGSSLNFGLMFDLR